jgi:predicted RecA/RadA family phage recombinase
MLNQLYPDGSLIQLPAPAAITKGMPVLIGTVPAVAIDNYNANTGRCTFCMEGIYALTVSANSTQSPVGGLAVGVGSELFASGTLDVTTNITYNLTIDKTRGNVPFGMYLGSAAIAAGGSSTTAPVRLNQQGTNDLV